MLSLKIPNKLLDHFHDVDTRLWVVNGIYYGYPTCCIIDFCERDTGEEPTHTQMKAHKGTGFVPCHRCATTVKKKTDLKLLLKNRRCDIDFPKG